MSCSSLQPAEHSRRQHAAALLLHTPVRRIRFAKAVAALQRNVERCVATRTLEGRIGSVPKAGRCFLAATAHVENPLRLFRPSIVSASSRTPCMSGGVEAPQDDSASVIQLET